MKTKNGIFYVFCVFCAAVLSSCSDFVKGEIRLPGEEEEEEKKIFVTFVTGPVDCMGCDLIESSTYEPGDVIILPPIEDDTGLFELQRWVDASMRSVGRAGSEYVLEKDIIIYALLLHDGSVEIARPK